MYCWLRLFYTPYSTSASLRTALFLCSRWWACSRGTNPCTFLLSTKNPFVSKLNKICGDTNFASGARLAASARAVHTSEIIYTVWPRSVPVEREGRYFRAFAQKAFFTIANPRKNITAPRIDWIMISYVARVPRRAESRTVCRYRIPLAIDTTNFSPRKRVKKILRDTSQ